MVEIATKQLALDENIIKFHSVINKKIHCYNMIVSLLQTSPGSARPTPRGSPARHTPRASPARGTGSPTRPTSPRVGSPGRGVIHTPARYAMILPLSELFSR